MLVCSKLADGAAVLQEDPLAAFTKPAAQSGNSWTTFGNEGGQNSFDAPPAAEDYFGDDPLAAYSQREEGARCHGLHPGPRVLQARRQACRWLWHPLVPHRLAALDCCD